ncbi:MAG: hypothetical protein KatS3mg061_0697 [Dehalococcoidia bacterium]|nr:MAG: hypothetical protein KatS3mg061_0697 [Dehalococcoidia bacterium]
MARVPALLRPPSGPFALSPDLEMRRQALAAPAGFPRAILLRWLAVLAIGGVGYALAVLLVVAFPTLLAAPPADLVAAALNSLVLAGLASAGSLATGGVLALAIVVGPGELRSPARLVVDVVSGLPAVVIGLALLLMVGRPEEPGAAVLAVMLGQSLVFGPQLARRMVTAALAASRPADEAAQDLGADGWLRFRVVVLPLLARAVPGWVGLVFALAVADLVMPVLLAGPLPTLPGLLWRHALAGDAAGAAAAAVLFLAASSVTLLLGGSQPHPTGTSPGAALTLPQGWASLVLTLAVGVVFPLLMAPLLLVTAADGPMTPLLESWSPALGGALLGGALATGVTIAWRQLTGRGRWLVSGIQLLPPAGLGLAVAIAAAGLLGVVPWGSVLFLALVGGTVGLVAAERALPPPPPLPPAVAEAARDLGADPALVAPPLPARQLAGSALAAAAEGLGTGTLAVVALVSASHPLVLSLSAELVSRRPLAASAAVTILLLVGLLRLAASWACRGAPQAGSEQP